MMLLVGLVVLMSLMGGKLVGKIQSHKLSDAAKTKSSSISSQENQASRLQLWRAHFQKISILCNFGSWDKLIRAMMMLPICG